MPKIKDTDYREMKSLLDRVETLAGDASSLQAAAEACAREVYGFYRDSLVLFRIYATVKYAGVPPDVGRFVRGITDAHGLTPLLQPTSIVLSLLGTAGAQPEWNDRMQSRGHLGIPLLNADFVENLPMVAKLMRDMGIGLDWLDTQDTSIVIKEVGRLARVFFVADARTTVDDKGRNVVPAADFVAENGVRTVFGLGGAYIDGTFLAMIFFTRETLDKRQAEAFQPVLNLFKMSTLKSIVAGQIFA